jgi:hypothetical protein
MRGFFIVICSLYPKDLGKSESKKQELSGEQITYTIFCLNSCLMLLKEVILPDYRSIDVPATITLNFYFNIAKAI